MTTTSDTDDGLVTDEQYLLYEGLLSSTRALIAALGCMGNVINIYIFLKLGFNEGMNLSLTLLSCFDLMYLVTVISRSVSFVFLAYERTHHRTMWFPVQPYAVYIFCGHAGRIPHASSNLMTTFVALARCASVAKPLHFKQTFSQQLTVIWATVFVVFAVVSYLPILVFMGVIPQFDKDVNLTRPALWISPRREEVKDAIWGLRDAFLPLSTQLLIAVCVVLMTRYLKASLKFKAVHSKYSFTQGVVNEISQNIGITTATKSNGSSTTKPGKELQVIQQVVLICVVYITCNTPTILINFTGLFVPEFSIETKFRNLYLLVTGVKHFFQTINASINILVYHRYNSKYRRRFPVCRHRV
ncbi:uncharacterized protein LOC131955105 [Physella acuta]|uniref:uncharacterized protein LOC131955105 n=1 Tax=Physella acuta TaxID=109671 RepID=UPI0027DB00BB|nr:uncharacterized protein LOC131955105 [Physella acuta]